MENGLTPRLWWRSLRAYSFPATIIPVACASLAAWREVGVITPCASALLLLTALLLHAAVNVLNDYYDFTLGFDNAASAGSSGLLTGGMATPRTLLAWGRTYLLLALVTGVPLTVWSGSGWLPALGACGWLGAFFYSHGRGYKQRGLGEVAVFLLMGPALYCAAYIAAGGVMGWRPLLLSLPFGAMVTAIMVVNNLRDMAHDRQAGLRTLPQRLGARCTMVLFAVLLLAAPVAAAFYSFINILPPACALTLLSAAPAVRLTRAARAAGLAGGVPAAMPQKTAALYLLFGLLVVAGEVAVLLQTSPP